MTIDLDGDALHVEVLRSPQRRSTAQLKYAAGTFVLRVPQSCSEAWITEFLHQRRQWMQRTRKKQRQQLNIRQILPGCVIATEFYRLFVDIDESLVFPKYRVVKNARENTATFFLAAGFFARENLS